MHISLLAALLALQPSMPTIAYRWLVGLDLVIPWAAVDNGPAVNALGFDRDTSTFTILHRDSGCYTQWAYAPGFRGEGGVTHLLQANAGTIAAYFESGRLDFVRVPDHLPCTPLAVQP